MEEITNQPLPQQETTTPAPNAANADLARLMAISLNNGVEPQTEVAPAAQTTPQETGTPPVSEEFQTLGVDEYWKTNYGWDSEAIAKQEIEQLRALKNNPQATQYANDESRQLHEAITDPNKWASIVSTLNRKMQVERLIGTEVTKENAPEYIKMGMELKYKDLNLSPEEISYKFNKQFAIPAKPVMGELEDETEYQQKVNAWQEQVNDKHMEMMIEAKLAKPEILAAKSKIELPQISAQVDEGYLAYKKLQEDSRKATAQTVEAYKTFTPKTIETKMNFNDEANGVKFDFSFEPDAKSFGEAVEMVADMNKFFNRFINSDGSPNRQAYLDFVYKGLNFDKIVQEAMNQTKNATIKAKLPDNSGGVVRHLPQTQEVSEFDKRMRQSLQGYM